jgi:ArsR family transcriptional regulator
MDTQEAIIMFDALSQETRLDAFRLLVEAGPGGLPAGTLSEKLGTPHNTMSFHLNHLSNAGIVTSRREGRSVIYSANFNAVQQLIRFMIEDCCNVEAANIREDRKTGYSIIELSGCCEVQPKLTKERKRS